MTTDDLKDIPHVVIVETATGIKLFEYGRGLMEQAHVDAQRIAMQPGFTGRVIVTARVRQLAPASCKLIVG